MPTLCGFLSILRSKFGSKKSDSTANPQVNIDLPFADGTLLSDNPTPKRARSTRRKPNTSSDLDVSSRKRPDSFSPDLDVDKFTLERLNLAKASALGGGGLGSAYEKDNGFDSKDFLGSIVRTDEPAFMTSNDLNRTGSKKTIRSTHRLSETPVSFNSQRRQKKAMSEQFSPPPDSLHPNLDYKRRSQMTSGEIERGSTLVDLTPPNRIAKGSLLDEQLNRKKSLAKASLLDEQINRKKSIKSSKNTTTYLDLDDKTKSILDMDVKLSKSKSSRSLRHSHQKTLVDIDFDFENRVEPPSRKSTRVGQSNSSTLNRNRSTKQRSNKSGSRSDGEELGARTDPNSSKHMKRSKSTRKPNMDQNNDDDVPLASIALQKLQNSLK